MEESTPKQISFAKTLGIDNPEQFNKNELRVIIDEKLNKTTAKPSDNKTFTKAETPRERIADTKSTTMYTSYAKDIFIAISTNDDVRTTNNLMLEAISLVKQARDAFS